MRRNRTCDKNISIIDVPLPHLLRLYNRNCKICNNLFNEREKIDIFCMVRKSSYKKKIWFLAYRKSGICIVNKGKLSLLLGVIHTGSCDYLPARCFLCHAVIFRCSDCVSSFPHRFIWNFWPDAQINFRHNKFEYFMQ